MSNDIKKYRVDFVVTAKSIKEAREKAILFIKESGEGIIEI